MDIVKQRDGDVLTVKVAGRLDTTTAPELETELAGSLDDVTGLVLDFKNLDYLSSAGLRVLLATQKQMNRQGSMTVKHVNDVIMDVFDITGFSSILTIENE
ncbi:MAG TPA: STAS domain-containing protein [Clostridiaceae bacterium]|nr:STAS domain-containing protein [Clostridiaceae bacterium]